MRRVGREEGEISRDTGFESEGEERKRREEESKMWKRSNKRNG